MTRAEQIAAVADEIAAMAKRQSDAHNVDGSVCLRWAEDKVRALAAQEGERGGAEVEVLRAAADEIGPFQGAVLVGPVGDAFCAGWDAALAAVRERADGIEGES